MRDISKEDTKEKTGSSPAVSSHKALAYNLISPFFIRKLAVRLSGGAAKYGSVQWRQGINDSEYVADRFNHFFEHLLKFMEEGNKGDDNLGAMIWGLHCLCEVERLSPQGLNHIVGMCDMFASAPTKFHKAEEKRRGKE